MSQWGSLLDDDESETSEERLAVDLAREGQHLVVTLIETRKRLNISQEQLAQRIGVTQATISAFERIGNDPRMSTIRRYARALGVMVRHHVEDEANCFGSHYLAHVSDRGVTQQETAEAVRRGLRSQFSTDWSRPPADYAARAFISAKAGAK